MKKFLIPLATAIAALVSQQSLAADTSNQDKASLSNPAAETVNQGSEIAALKATLSEATSNLTLVKAKANLVRIGHSSHRSHGSHSSHRSHRSHRSGR